MAKPTKRQRERLQAAERFDGWFGKGSKSSRLFRRESRRIDERKRAQFRHRRGNWREALRSSEGGSATVDQ